MLGLINPSIHQPVTSTFLPVAISLPPFQQSTPFGLGARVRHITGLASCTTRWWPRLLHDVVNHRSPAPRF